MRDAPVSRATPTPPLPPLQRLAAAWRRARSAALLHSLADVDEPGRPSPRRLAPWAHPTLRGLAHPATWEVGVPATAILVVGKLLQRGPEIIPQHAEQRILLALCIPVVVFVFRELGRGVLNGRYTRLALEEYQRVRWAREQEGRGG